MRVLRWVIVSLVYISAASAQSVDEGVTLFNKGKIAEAKKVFESVLKQDDNNAEAHYRLGFVFLSNQFRNEDDAVDQMERATEINPQSADYQYGLGAAYGTKAQNAGILKQAFLAPKVKKAFEKAVKLNPNLINAHIGLAQYYQRAPGIMGGDMAKAFSEADRIIELDEIRGRTFKANLYVSDKKAPEALNEIKTLRTNKAGDWRAWRAAGQFYMRNQMTDDAVQSFEMYTTLRPDTADSFHFLARAYIQKKDPDKAVTQAKKSLALDGNYAPAIDVLAQAYELKGQKKEARESYQRLLTMDLSREQKENIQKKVDALQ
jgi:tetratricopeptide (TPR) repeat protein